MWEFTLVKLGDWSARPEDFYGNSKFICDESEATGAPSGESFFSRPREKNSRSRAREKRRGGNENHRPI